MSQNLGSVDKPLEITGEQWVLETRTDDPTNPGDGECWIREDLNSGDRVATLLFGDGTEVPLFATGTAKDTVSEARRLQVNGQTVYAPIIPAGDATYPAHRMEHNGEVYGLHDAMSPNGIPDSVVERPADNSSASTTNKQGTRIETDVEWPEIGARLSANVSGPTRAYVFRVSDGQLMGDIDILNKVAGDTLTIDLDNPLQPFDGTNATRYNFVADAEGASWTNGWLDGSSFNYTSSDGNISMINGASGETGSYSDAQVFDKIGNVGFS